MVVTFYPKKRSGFCDCCSIVACAFNIYKYVTINIGHLIVIVFFFFFFQIWNWLNHTNTIYVCDDIYIPQNFAFSNFFFLFLHENYFEKVEVYLNTNKKNKIIYMLNANNSDFDDSIHVFFFVNISKLKKSRTFPNYVLRILGFVCIKMVTFVSI